MLVLPVVARELLIQARRKSTYWIRVAASAVAGLLMLCILLMGAAPMPTISQGRTLFSILSTLAFVYCLLIGALVTADCLSAEKREGTLGLLFLTDLNGCDVVLGKLVSSSIHCAYGLLAVMPMLAMALLFGGVTVGEITRTALVLGTALFLSLSAGMFASTVSQNERRSVFGAVLLILVVTAGPYEVGYVLANNFARGTAFDVAESVLSPSPAFAFNLAQSTAGAQQGWALYSSVAQTGVMACALLGLSCAIVPHVCRDRPEGPRRERWRQRARRWRLGTGAERAAFRRRLLERNPCLWLSSRERHKAALVWIPVGGLAAIGLWICLRYTLVFYETSLFLLFTLHLLLKVWFVGETCQRWIEDRRSGALELLLCAPLRTRELIQGQAMALRRQFGWPVAATIVLTLGAWLVIVLGSGRGANTQFGRTWLLMGLVALVADLAALRWVGAWSGLTARGLNRAIAGTLARVLLLRWLLYLACLGTASVWEWIQFGDPRRPEESWFWLVLALPLDLILGWSARRNFLKHLRGVAASPADYRSPARIIVSPTELLAGSKQGVTRTRSDAAPGTRRRQRVAWIAACLFLVAAVPSGYRYWLKSQVNRRIKALQQAGFPVTDEELDRRRPPLANGVNAAEVLAQAFPGSLMWYALPRPLQQNLPGFRSEFPSPAHPLTAAMKEAINGFLSSNQMALTVVHAAASLGRGRYAMDWESVGGRFASQSQAVWLVGHLLQCEAVVRADEGDVAGALDSVRRLLALTRSLELEPAPVFQRMRATCAERAFIGLEWLLARCPLSDSVLRTLEREVAEVEAGTELEQALAGMRCLNLVWYRSPPSWVTRAGSTGPSTLESLRVQLRNQVYELTGAKDRELIAFLDSTEEFMSVARRPLPERFYRGRALAGARQQADANGGPSALFSPRFVFESLISPDAEMAARCRAGLTGLAIERFRLRHGGRLPERLGDLAPEFVSEVARDPFDGRPIRYQRLGNGYGVYSVGKNGVDDGGVEALRTWQGRRARAGDDITFSVAH